MIRFKTRMFSLVAVMGIIACSLVFQPWVNKVEATNQFNITLCHHTPGNKVTLNFNNLGSYLGHLGQPHSGQTYDTAGACPSPSPSPSPTPSPSATPSPTPSSTPEPSSTPTPTETPSPTPVPSAQEQGLSSAGVESKPCPKIEFAPTIRKETIKRIDADSIEFAWTSVDAGVTDYVVEYGLGPLVLPWRTVIEGRQWTDLNFLPAWMHVWMRVAGTKGGCVGPFSETIDP